MELKWIDVHAHLEMLEIPNDEALELARQNQVRRMITIGTHPEENKKVIAIAERFHPTVCCALGIHPHEAKFYNDAVEVELETQCRADYVVGVGEIGLDYHYSHSEHDVQREAFRRQLALAQRLGLPIEIHTRDAEKDTVEILKEFPGTRGLVHCFTGTAWLAKEALDLGLDISFSGIVTFKNAEDLRRTLRTVPLDRLHIETDSPFLAPIPHRGKKNNPALLVHTAQFVADFLGLTLEKLSERTWANAHRLFPRLGRAEARQKAQLD
jgi:TatD DNase family protein